TLKKESQPSSLASPNIAKDISFSHGRGIPRSVGGQFPKFDIPVTSFDRIEDTQSIMPASDAVEERIEGVEAVVEKLLHTLQQLTRKVEQLEQTVTSRSRGRQRPTTTCVDNLGATRRLKETWLQDPCTKCFCRVSALPALRYVLVGVLMMYRSNKP
ncbi:hypothetical protein FHG87_024554, partial [Trinorchestia longiramus]